MKPNHPEDSAWIRLSSGFKVKFYGTESFLVCSLSIEEGIPLHFKEFNSGDKVEKEKLDS